MKELQNIVNVEVKRIENWMAANKLTINQNKIKSIAISKNRIPSPINIFLNSLQIEQADQYDSLGTTINSKLKWSTHIKN